MTDPNAYRELKPISFLYLDKGHTSIKGEPAREEKHIRIQQDEDMILFDVKDIDKVIRALTRAKNYVITSQREAQKIDSE